MCGERSSWGRGDCRRVGIRSCKMRRAETFISNGDGEIERGLAYYVLT